PFDNAIFPGYCDTYTGATLTAQEKTLLFMLFDLGACVSTDEPVVPSCNPETCGTRCGIVPDGCGGTLSCGECPPPSCIPTTCSTEGATCGTIADGCGGTVTCGPCEAGQICGLVAPNQ